MSIHHPPTRRRRNQTATRTLLPHGQPPSPPPPAALRVERVLVRPIEPWFAVWVFSEAVEDPTEAVDGLRIGEHGGQSWSREAENSLLIDHGLSINAGMPWTCAAGAGGIRTADGQPLQAGEGTVGEEVE